MNERGCLSLYECSKMLDNAAKCEGEGLYFHCEKGRVGGTRNAATGRCLKRVTEVAIGVQSLKASRVAGTVLEVIIFAIFAELRKVADGVIGLLSVKFSILRSTAVA